MPPPTQPEHRREYLRWMLCNQMRATVTRFIKKHAAYITTEDVERVMRACATMPVGGCRDGSITMDCERLNEIRAAFFERDELIQF